MKVAVTSTGTELTSEVDQRFGRARVLMVVDTETMAFSAHDNSLNLNAAQGAGIQTAKNIADLGVEAVLTGNVGPKAFAALNTAGINIFTGVKGTVTEAVEMFKTGSMQNTERANVDGHWI